MKTRNLFLRCLIAMVLLWVAALIPISGWAESAHETDRATPVMKEESPEGEDYSQIVVELFLSAEHKSDLDAIKKEFGAVSITKVRPQLFRLGNPPENIAIGKNVPAPVARLAIQVATTYNRGVKYLNAEGRLPLNYIAIGNSLYDEASQIPISPDDLKRLSDPALTTPQFHALYRQLTGEDQRQP